MRLESGGSPSQFRSAGSPPRRISKLPSGATSNWVSLITPAVFCENPPSAAPACRPARSAAHPVVFPEAEPPSIAIEKFNIVEWIDIQDELSAQIENFLNDNGVVIIEDATSAKKVPVTVYAESTPNPAVLKFVTNKKIVTETLEFKNIDEAKNAPLALALFHFPFVKEVFMDSNYVSVQKYDVAEWDDVFQEVREFIKTYIEEGKEIISENFKKTPQAVEEQKEVEFEAMDDTSKEIANIIEEYVKPAVASDGGNILFKHYDPESKNVKVILQGACSGCPSSTFTLKNGIENMLKEMLRGKINSVEAING